MPRPRRRGPKLNPERTPCGNCGLDTQTSSNGYCVECWRDKSDEGRSPFPREERTEPALDLGDWEWAWWGVGVVTAVAIGFALSQLL